MRKQNALLNEGDKRQHNLGQMTLYFNIKKLKLHVQLYSVPDFFLLSYVSITSQKLFHFVFILKLDFFRNYSIFLLTNQVGLNFPSSPIIYGCILSWGANLHVKTTHELYFIKISAQ